MAYTYFYSLNDQLYRKQFEITSKKKKPAKDSEIEMKNLLDRDKENEAEEIADKIKLVENKIQIIQAIIAILLKSRKKEDQSVSLWDTLENKYSYYQKYFFKQPLESLNLKKLPSHIDEKNETIYLAKRHQLDILMAEIGKVSRLMHYVWGERIMKNSKIKRTGKHSILI